MGLAHRCAHSRRTSSSRRGISRHAHFEHFKCGCETTSSFAPKDTSGLWFLSSEASRQSSCSHALLLARTIPRFSQDQIPDRRGARAIWCLNGRVLFLNGLFAALSLLAAANDSEKSQQYVYDANWDADKIYGCICDPPYSGFGILVHLMLPASKLNMVIGLERSKAMGTPKFPVKNNASFPPFATPLSTR